jgi:S-adenosylmethionine/arginine decarboxylase-like enzyme
VHLTVDGVLERPQDFNLMLLAQWLDALPAKLKDANGIGMHAIIPPIVFRHDDTVQGIILIAESHIKIEGNLVTKEFHGDVFSCKSFDPEIALEELRLGLRVNVRRAQLIERGLEYLTVGADGRHQRSL